MSMKATCILALVTGAVACLTDLRHRRIPNVLTFGSALLAIGYRAAVGGGHGFVQALGGWFTGVAFFVVPFALGGMGGGDVKLVAALGAWLGPADTVWLALYTGAAGGVLALGVAAVRGYLQQALQNIWLLLAHWRVSG